METQANITLWMIAIRQKLVEETDARRRAFLAELYLECNKRLPYRRAT